MLADFRHRYRDAAERVEELLRQGQPATAARILHTLKGVAGNLAMPALREDAQALEHEIHAAGTATGAASQAETMTASLRTRMQATLGAIDDLLAGHRPHAPDQSAPLVTATPAVQSSPLEKLVATLEAMLAGGSMDACDMFDQIRPLLQNRKAVKKELVRLERLIHNLDFEKAMDVLHAIKYRVIVPDLPLQNGKRVP
jgi:HPt (histidine-containing phosphotransfer) domain-containing protein